MEETTQATTEPTGAETTPQAEQGKTYTQEEHQRLLDAAIKERLAREKKKFADYDELRAKAEKLDEIEDANKTDLQKATERIAELESQIAARKAADERAELVARIADEHKVPSDYRCFLTADDEDGLTEQAAKLAERFAEPSLNEGQPPAETRTKKTKGQLFEDFFNGQL
ncbi:hypothetical protein [Adlercreutzia sp. ZJ138]|uniref:hypothetical protein n=1 Tax=Adlercreutzia sp. ZJ138 TaxID=2709405 RepID=UPI0013EB7199|nr:hypothetical protein [Adlercreutzia sp. ZJ138]